MNIAAYKQLREKSIVVVAIHQRSRELATAPTT
jgi:hypothetical protein